MKLRIRTNARSTDRIPTELPADLPLFHSSLALDRPSKLWSMLGSLAGHVLVITVITVLSQHMSWLGYEEIDWSRYREEAPPLRLRLSQPLYFASNRPAPAIKQHRSTPADRAAASGSVAATAASAGPRPAVSRRLELPVPRAAAQNAPVILQPDFVPQATPPPVALPPMAFWARKAPEVPKPPARTEVVPGRTEAPSPAPKLAAPPVLAVPNREATVADVNVAMPQTPASQPPALPLSNSATTPVRLKDATENKAASIEVAAGQAVNLMALSSEHRDIRNVEIARGLQNIPNLDGGRSGAGDDHSATATAAGRGATAGSETNAGTSSSANASGGNPHPGAPGGGRGSISENSAASETANAAGPSAVSSAVSSANTGERPGTLPAAGNTVTRTITPPEVMRIEHPTNGNFDVVVMQSATRDDLPDLGGILTGNPVYSVYLRVGDQKEWLLEYCVPAREVAQTNPYQINLDEAGAITPPYPISTMIPSNLLSQQIGKPVVLHGYLTAAGSFQGIKSRDNTNPFLSQLLTLLNQWQFRPALRNKKPIDIEIVLVIPPRA